MPHNLVNLGATGGDLAHPAPRSPDTHADRASHLPRRRPFCYMQWHKGGEKHTAQGSIPLGKNLCFATSEEELDDDVVGVLERLETLWSPPAAGPHILQDRGVRTRTPCAGIQEILRLLVAPCLSPLRSDETSPWSRAEPGGPPSVPEL